MRYSSTQILALYINVNINVMGEYMKSVIVEFKVSMDSEQAKLKNHKLVTLKVEYPESVVDQVFKAATKSYVIDLQGQIRNHWDSFSKCDLPDVMEFGTPLYSKKTKVVKRKPTQKEIDDSAAQKFSKMTPEQIAEFVRTGRFPEGV